MENRFLIIGIVITILLIIGGVVFLTQNKEMSGEVEQPDNREYLQLIRDSLELGKDSEQYTYRFVEDFNGFETEYEIIKNGERTQINIINPLSSQQIYLFPNETIFCIQFKENEACSNITENEDMQLYLDRVTGRIITDDRINKDLRDFDYMVNKEYLTLIEVQEKEECTEIKYKIDFANITLTEAARFGIGGDSPKQFEWIHCIDSEKKPLWKELRYNSKSGETVFKYRLEEFKKSAPTLRLPENISAGAVGHFRDERSLISTVGRCYNEAEDKEDCVRDEAIIQKEPLLCSLAGDLKDACYVAMVPVMKNPEPLCDKVESKEMKEACYVELAGALKDNKYCMQITDSEKKELCEQAAQEEEKPEINPEELLQQVEEQ